ncbi:MAG: glycerophosphoryl diester phosphodiesterase [bacterium]|jgi:glycerophosphoryl diester phosphodiesterase
MIFLSTIDPRFVFVQDSAQNAYVMFIKYISKPFECHASNKNKHLTGSDHQVKNNDLRWSDPQDENNDLPRSDPQNMKHVDVYAHRGSTVLAPENTSAAFELALGLGADVLEIDVRLTRDREVIVTHDARVDRTCNGHGAVIEKSLVDLKNLNAGWHFTDIKGKNYRQENIGLMTLTELFEQFPSARINIDIKDNSQDAAKAVSHAISRAGAESRVNVGSFHAKALAYFRIFSPQVTTAATQPEVAQLYFGRSLVTSVKYQYLQIPTQYFALPLATQSFIRFAQKKNLVAVYWTINQVADMKTLINRGVDGIVTDRVDLACSLLSKTAKT